MLSTWIYYLPLFRLHDLSCLDLEDRAARVCYQLEFIIYPYLDFMTSHVWIWKMELLRFAANLDLLSAHVQTS